MIMEPEKVASGGGALIDGCGRTITYFRVSVTDRCNMRCVYCMPEGTVFLPREEMLGYDEIERVVRVGASVGISKVRLTGGEPLARKNIEYLVGRLAGFSGLTDLSLTTNGLLLSEKAAALAAAGLHRVNVSLDTLKPDRFKSICRAGELGSVLEGIAAAHGVGLKPVKLNVVVMRGRNDDEIEDFIDFGVREGVIVRFIEYMPILRNSEWENLFVSHEETTKRILHRIEPIDVRAPDTRAPARYFKVRGSGGYVGFVSPVTHGFCAMCNRMRLTPDGRLLACLLAGPGLDLKPLLRGGASDAEIAGAFALEAAEKGRAGAFSDIHRPMHTVGG
jgi:GTP 3',8-cyclase